MTLEEWRSNPALAEELRKTFDLPIMKMAREVIESISPTHQIGALSMEVIAHNAQFALGKIEGYHERDRAYDLLMQAPKEIRQPREDYGAQPEK